MSETEGLSSEDGSNGQNEQTSSRDILTTQIEEGLHEIRRETDGLLLSGLSAGLDIGFGPLLMAIMLTLVSGVYAKPLEEILVANMYAVGFIFVVLGRSELFTEHTTLAVLPVLDRQASLPELGRLWGLIYAGNVVGTVAFAAFAVVFVPDLHVADMRAFVELAHTYTTYDSVTLFAAAILAGWLMGLLSWLVTAAQDTISRVLVVWIITASIGFAHLPHCIAGSVEVLMGVFVGQHLGVADYAHFMLFSTAGNIVGGSVFVALLKYGHVVRGGG